MGQRIISDTLATEGRFNNVLEMIGRAGFTDQLRGPGPLTLFAPTDGAMTGAPAAHGAAPGVPRILHRARAAPLRQPEPESAPGQQFGAFGAAGSNVMPPAPITQADIPASNGIIDVLGGVIFP
jgi:uncharacterized surface protein with fasciclin (FAS1) repeats